MTKTHSVIFLAAALSLCSCKYSASPWLTDYMSTGYYEGCDNRAKMDKIRVGMTKAQILEIMGEPLRKEIYNTPDVWYYYTVSRWSDSISAREESTPVVFKNGVVIGWGVDYYKTNFEFKDPKDIGKGDELSPGNALLKEWEQKYDKQAQEKPKDK